MTLQELEALVQNLQTRIIQLETETTDLHEYIDRIEARTDRKIDDLERKHDYVEYQLIPAIERQLP